MEFLAPIALCSVSFVSLSFNAYLLIKNSKQKAQIDDLEAFKALKKNLTIDAQQLMHDLTRGAAIVQITPLNPDSLYMRSPDR